MHYLRYIRRTGAALLLLSVIGLTGCTDRMLTEPTERPTADEPATSESKLRYAHLLKSNDAGPGAKRILERYEEIATETEFILGFSSTVLEPQRVLERYEDENGVTVERSFETANPGFSMHVDEEEVERVLSLIEDDSDIAWVEPDPNVQNSSPTTKIDYDDGQYLPWGVDHVDADELLESTGLNLVSSTDEVHVFVLDGGISSPDVNICETRSFLSGHGNQSDQTGHGTHIAGTIGGKDNAEGVVGVAPNVCLHDYRVMDGNGRVELSTVVEAVDYITALKAEHPSWPMVVNISLGADVGSTTYNALDEAIQASTEAGVIYVIAAGNDGIDASTVTPAHVQEAITVGAHEEKDSNGEYKFASFSNHGSFIDVSAPGTDIISLPSTTTGDDRLRRMSGTSTAAAHVSGAIADYLAVKDPSASTEDIMDNFWKLTQSDVENMPEGTTNRRIYVGDLLMYLYSWY